MTTQPNKLALAFATTAAIVYAVCSAIVAIAPDTASTLIGWLTHLSDLEPGARELTIGTFFGGLLQVAIVSYLAALLFGVLYDRWTREASGSG